MSFEEEASELSAGTDFMSWVSMVSPPEASTFWSDASGLRGMFQEPGLESDGRILLCTSEASTLTFCGIPCVTASN